MKPLPRIINGPKTKFTVEFEVDQGWIDDGFDPDDLAFRDKFHEMLPFAFFGELSAKIIKKEFISS